jgi:hypothetical protein
MQETTYPVFLNLKIPWLTKAFYYLFIGCLIILFVFGIYMLPSQHSGDEMKAAYFVLTTSEFEKILFVIGLIGTPTFYILYRHIRFKRQALLSLFCDKIEVDNYKTVTSYSINEITHIACNDALTREGFPKGKLTIDFKDKVGSFISMTLIDYSHSDQIMDAILNYENIKFDVTNFTSNPEVLDME